MSMIIYFVVAAIFLILVILIILIATKVIAPKTTFNPLLQQFLFDNSLENGFCTDVQKAAGVPCTGNPVSGVRGQCNLYTTFSSATNVVDQLTPTPLFTGACNDGFVQGLQKNSRTCLASECLGKDGKIYTNGQIEEIYVSCADLPDCTAKREAIIFNYFIDPITQKLTPKAGCMVSSTNLTAQQGALFEENCSVANQQLLSQNSQISPFPLLDETVLQGGYTLTSLRSTNQIDCLAPLVSSNPEFGIPESQTQIVACSSLPVVQNWLFVPDLCSIFTPGCFPQQIVTRPSDSDLGKLQQLALQNDVDGQVSVLKGYLTLGVLPGNNLTFQLSPFASSFCNNYNSAGTVTDDTCVNRTGIIDALVFPSLF